MQSIAQAFFVLAFAALVSAQAGSSFGSLPKCAKPCAANLPTNCNLDVRCICADSSFISGISCCVAKACSPSDVQKTLEVATQLCDTVNVEVPSAVPSTCAAASGTTATSGAGNTASSMATSAGSTASSAARAVTSGTSTTGESSATGSSTGSTSSSATAASNTNGAAGQNFGSKIGAVGAAFAALALF
ncbi:MAG: hypothetical protein Q9217_005031 [Psora testacea]